MGARKCPALAHHRPAVASSTARPAKNMHYYDMAGGAVRDAPAGLWCANAGHCRAPIVEAIQKQAADLDFAPTFQFGHPKVFELASRLATMAPGDLNYAFFCNSGSEAADTALKIALAYHRVRGDASRVRLIGRERGYHGVNFGGISVGGMVANRKFFGAMINGVDHLPHTYNRAEQAYSRGEPKWAAPSPERSRPLWRCLMPRRSRGGSAQPVGGQTAGRGPPTGYLKKIRGGCE